MTYKLTLPPDFPYGIEPETIIDYSPTLENFSKAIDIMASESQVLILINSRVHYNNNSQLYSQLMAKLEKNCFILRPAYTNDKYDKIEPLNKEAGKWVRAHSPQIKNNMASCDGEQKKKYLIGNWHSAAGYEVPAVIYVTDCLADTSNATFCLRAKGKLVIYQFHHTITYRSNVSATPIPKEPIDNLTVKNLIKFKAGHCCRSY